MPPPQEEAIYAAGWATVNRVALPPADALAV
jgi:hypothetical protein